MLPSQDDPQRELERIKALEKECRKTMEKTKDVEIYKQHLEILDRLLMTKKQLKEDIIKSGV